MKDKCENNKEQVHSRAFIQNNLELIHFGIWLHFIELFMSNISFTHELFRQDNNTEISSYLSMTIFHKKSVNCICQNLSNYFQLYPRKIVLPAKSTYIGFLSYVICQNYFKTVICKYIYTPILKCFLIYIQWQDHTLW